MKDLVSSFNKLVNELSSAGTRESDLSLMQLEPVHAERLRRCAIAHTFDSDILRVLEPGLDAAEAEQAMQAFELVPAVIRLSECLALHDVVRAELFATWLEPQHREEFGVLSRRLAEHYRPQPDDSPDRVAQKENAFLFHLVGADVVEGFDAFQNAYDERRRQARFSECEALVRLLREYRPILGPREAAWLGYYEAEIATDSRDWQRALQHLEKLVSGELPPELRAAALLLRGSVLRRQKRLAEARDSSIAALSFADTARTPDMMFRVRQELGIVARDDGDFDTARSELQKAISAAEHDKLNLAIAKNSLGTLLLKPFPQEAVASFRQALELLDPKRDGVRIAQVLNNLAMATSNVGNWTESERLYQESFSIKQAAGDLYGQALTLLNMARNYQAAGRRQQAWKALLESASLFASVHSTRDEAAAHGELARLARILGARSDLEFHANKAIELLQRVGASAEAEVIRRELMRRGGGGVAAMAVVGILLLILIAGFIVVAADL